MRPISTPILHSNAEMHRRSIEDAYGSIWRVGNKEMGDDVDCLSFLILVLVCLLEGTHADRVGLDVYR